MITVVNAGPDIVETNYWQSPYALEGLCYVTMNAGTIRLLVPESATQQQYLEEMKTGTMVTIEPSQVDAGSADIVFEDGTSAPFFVGLDLSLFEALPTVGAWELAVWTPEGKVLELPCQVRKGLKRRL